MESMDEAENIEMDKAAMEESLFNAIAAHDPEFKWLTAAHDPEFKLAEHRTKKKKKNNKKKNR